MHKNNAYELLRQSMGAYIICQLKIREGGRFCWTSSVCVLALIEVSLSQAHAFPADLLTSRWIIFSRNMQTVSSRDGVNILVLSFHFQITLTFFVKFPAVNLIFNLQRQSDCFEITVNSLSGNLTCQFLYSFFLMLAISKLYFTINIKPSEISKLSASQLQLAELQFI